MYFTDFYLLLEAKMLIKTLNSVADSVLHDLVKLLIAECSQELWLRATRTGGIWSPASKNAVRKPLPGS